MKKTILVVLVLVLRTVAEIANADFTLGTRIRVLDTYGLANQWASSISFDGLSLYFTSGQTYGSDDYDIWVTTRASVSDPWGQPVNLGSMVNSSRAEINPSISLDGLSLYFSDGAWIFSRPRPGGFGSADLWVTTRPSLNSDWGLPMNLGSIVNSSATEGVPSISSDNLSLFFESNRPGGLGSHDIWMTNRATPNDEWGAPMNLGPEVNSSRLDVHADISADGLALFFQSDRSGSLDLWITKRANTSDSFGPPVHIGPMIETPGLIEYPNTSTDGRTLFFSSSVNWILWQAPIIPIVDLNCDGIVDAADMCIIVDNWGTDKPLCDVGPMPWGDGIIDLQDLIVLAEHLFEEVLPIELVAYWKLDESKSSIALDSAGEYDGTLHGEPLWQPGNGMVVGALQFDGIDDYVSTPYIISPADGDFSIFAWIKGGVAGQVILSQAGGANWLMVDSVDGALKTDLKEPGKTGRNPIPPGPSLISSTVVTDGDWHRVGFVREGSNRIHYVDDIEAVRDTAAKLEASGGGLYIGTGCGLESGTFWSGLIDDVRIYNRAVIP